MTTEIVNYYPVGIQTFSEIRKNDYLYGELNNLNNTSMLDQSSAICGISQTEHTSVMKPDVACLGAQLRRVSEETA